MPEMTPAEAAEKLEELSAELAKQAETWKQMVCLVAASYLRAIAAGEYKQVVHGRWVHKDCDGAPTENHEAIVYAECSNCGHTIHNVDQEAEHCPHCGALMDGKDDSHE
jgi:hypothetical protein